MSTEGSRHLHIERGHVGTSQLMTVTDNTLPIVHFSFTFRHGALTDAKGAEGALAMLVPWLLRGTKRRSRQAFHEAIEALGSSVDASVGHEMAIIHGSCLRSQLSPTLSLVAEAFDAPLLDEDTLADLCDEARQGLIAERDDDDSVAELFLRQAFYDGTPLMHTPSGSVATLSRLDKSLVIPARAHLCAPRLIAAFAGDVSYKDAAREMQAVVQALPNEAPPAPTPITLPKSADKKPRIVLVDKPDRTQAQVRLATHGLDARHPDLDAFWLGVVAFGGTFTSPLTREVRDKRGWSYVAHADFRRRSAFASPVVLRTAPATQDAVACTSLQVDLLRAFCAGQIEAKDIARARDYLLGRAPFWTATAYDVVGPAVALETLGLPKERLFEDEARLEALALDSVPTIVHDHCKDASPVVVIVGSKEALLGPLAEAFAGATIECRPYTEGLDAAS